jgi:hypothetical protein
MIVKVQVTDRKSGPPNVLIYNMSRSFMAKFELESLLKDFLRYKGGYFKGFYKGLRRGQGIHLKYQVNDREW